MPSSRHLVVCAFAERKRIVVMLQLNTSCRQYTDAKAFVDAGGLMSYGIDFPDSSAAPHTLWTKSLKAASPPICRWSNLQNSSS